MQKSKQEVTKVVCLVINRGKSSVYFHLRGNKVFHLQIRMWQATIDEVPSTPHIGDIVPEYQQTLNSNHLVPTANWISSSQDDGKHQFLRRFNTSERICFHNATEATEVDRKLSP